MRLFGSGDKIQTDQTFQTGASEDAQLAQDNAQTAKDDAVAIGGQGNRNTLGDSEQVSGGLLNKGGYTATGTGTINVTDSGAFDLVKYIAGLNQSQSAAAISAVQSTAQSATAGQNDLLEKTLAGLSGLAESKQTDGASGQNKTVLYVVMALAAVAAIYFGKKK